MESKHMSGQMNIWERINAENINQQGINRTSMAESAEKDRASQHPPTKPETIGSSRLTVFLDICAM